MSYRALRAHVDAAEQQVVDQLRRNEQAWTELHDTARRGITPARLMGVGLLGGFLLGFSEPLERLARGTRFVNLASSLIAFVSSLRAQIAAAQLDAAAEQVDAAADTVEAASETATAAVREVA